MFLLYHIAIFSPTNQEKLQAQTVENADVVVTAERVKVKSMPSVEAGQVHKMMERLKPFKKNLMALFNTYM